MCETKKKCGPCALKEARLSHKKPVKEATRTTVLKNNIAQEKKLIVELGDAVFSLNNFYSILQNMSTARQMQKLTDEVDIAFEKINKVISALVKKQNY